MDQLLQQFEQPIVRDDEAYVAYLYGRSRPGDTWQGWLVFERLSDGERFTTPVETTQPNRKAVLYWATGLTYSYFDGALRRAMQPERAPVLEVVHPEGLEHIERDVLDFFARHGVSRGLTEALFRELPHAHADIVRALEALEQEGRMLVRRTEEGNDWVYLTDEGLSRAGLSSLPHTHQAVEAEPPKSAR